MANIDLRQHLKNACWLFFYLGSQSGREAMRACFTLLVLGCVGLLLSGNLLAADSQQPLGMGEPQNSPAVNINQNHRLPGTEGVTINNSHRPSDTQAVNINQNHRPSDPQAVNINQNHRLPDTEAVNINQNH